MFTATAKVPDVYGVKNKKQKLLAEEHDDFPEELGDFTPDCFSLVALKVLREYPNTYLLGLNFPPLILRSQLYYACASRTQVDRELNDMSRKKYIRIFSIPTKNETAIMFMSDYEAIIDKTLLFYQTKRENLSTNNSLNANVNKTSTKAKPASTIISLLDDVSEGESDFQNLETVSNNVVATTKVSVTVPKNSIIISNSPPEKKRSPTVSPPLTPSLQRNSSTLDAHIIEQFKKNVCMNYLEIKIDKEFLTELLNEESEIKITDFGILVRSGLLLKLFDGSYLFAIPNAGAFYDQCKQGQKEVLAVFKQQPFREILENELLKKRLTKSNLGMMFHIKDMIGLNLLKRTESPSGYLLTLTDNNL